MTRWQGCRKGKAVSLLVTYAQGDERFDCTCRFSQQPDKGSRLRRIIRDQGLRSLESSFARLDKLERLDVCAPQPVRMADPQRLKAFAEHGQGHHGLRLDIVVRCSRCRARA